MTGDAVGRGGRWSTFRLAARLARREVRRRPWRSLLVSLLIAVPVAGMVVATVWVRTDHQTPTDQWRAQFGNADLWAPGALRGASVEAGDDASLDDLLPVGTHSVSFRTEYDRILRTTDGRRSSAEITDLPMADPVAAPIMQVTDGRAPKAPGEVFLTTSVADRLDVHVGDTLQLERPHPTKWTIVGVGERRAWWDAESVVLGPGTPYTWRDDRTLEVLADLPGGVTSAQLAALASFPDGLFAPGLVQPGAPGSSGYEAFDGAGATATVAWSWVLGALVLTVAGIVIAAAFAAGARRQLTTLGQLAANGAPPAVLRRVLFLQGTWTGLVGVALGGGLAGVALAAVAPHVDNLLGHDVDPYIVRPADLVPIVVLGLGAATVAALVPARTTARIPVLAALAGRRVLRPPSAWLAAVGLGLGVAGLGLLGLAVLGGNSHNGGAVWALTAVVGGVAVLLGTCALAPGYVSALEPLAGRLRGGPRLAARSLARQRTRTGAVVSAVCATSALAIAAAALMLSAEARDGNEPDWMRADEIHLQAAAQDVPAGGGQLDSEQAMVAVPGHLLAAVTAAIPDSDVHQIAAVGVPGTPDHARWEARDFVPAEPTEGIPPAPSLMSGPSPQLAVADDTLLDLYDLPAPARRALADDGIVAITGGSAAGAANVVLVVEQFQESSATASTTQSPSIAELAGPFTTDVVAQDDLALGTLPRILLTPGRARTLGLEPMIGPIVIRAPEPLSNAQRTAVQDILDEYRDTARDGQPGDRVTSVSEQMLYPSAHLDPRLLEGLLTGAAFLLSMFVVAASLAAAAAAAETRDERDILVVVGAAPSTMRRTSGYKALILTLLGAALAIPVGFLPVSVFTAANNGDLPLVFPWRVVALLLVAVPAVAAAVTTFGSGLALRLRPVRVSTMAFD